MKDSQLMQGFETPSDLDKQTPQLVLREFCVVLGVLNDFGVEVALVGELHDDAKHVNNSTYYRKLVALSMKDSLYAMTLGWFIDANILTSLSAFYFSLYVRLFIFTFLMA